MMHVLKYMATCDVRPAELLCSDVSDTNFGECYLITVLWD
jgi:hypothetical protein